MLLLIGGLSGAGKSKLGCYLKKRCAFTWIELDGEKDMVDELNIRAEWEAFRQGNSALISKLHPGKTVLTVPSFPIITPPTYLGCDQVRIRYLSGCRKQCFSRAKSRSPQLTQEHWDLNNKDMLAFLDSNCPPEWKVEVFDQSGKPRSREELARVVTGRSGK